MRDEAEVEFDALWQEQAAVLARLATAMGVERSAVSDVLQDVYLTAWKKRPRDRPTEDLRKWLVRVTVNRCNLEHRRATRWRAAWHRLVHRTNGQLVAQPDQATERDEYREAVRRVLKQMEPRLRAILVLRYYADFNSRQIAEILGLADSTVRGHLRTGREQLAAKLDRAGYCHE